MNERSQGGESDELTAQWELARTSAVLSVIIAAAVLVSNFGSEPRDLVDARSQREIHRKILREHQELLLQNKNVLKQNQETLARIRAPRPSP